MRHSSRAIAPASKRSAAIFWDSTTMSRRMRSGPRPSPAFPPTPSANLRGAQPYWAAIVLAAMLGGIGLPGGGFAFGHGSSNGIGVPRVDVAGPEIPLPLNPARSMIPVARMADMMLHPGESYEFNGR